MDVVPSPVVSQLFPFNSISCWKCGTSRRTGAVHSSPGLSPSQAAETLPLQASFIHSFTGLLGGWGGPAGLVSFPICPTHGAVLPAPCHCSQKGNKVCEAQLTDAAKSNFVSSWHTPQNSSLVSRSGFQIKAISATAGSNWFKAKIHSFSPRRSSLLLGHAATPNRIQQ